MRARSDLIFYLIYTAFINILRTQDAIDASPDKRLDEERARFYAAEIALVLFHLHEMGLMYR